ncbi:MAG: hypothetical protein V7L12_07965 [Nostoc sp.]
MALVWSESQIHLEQQLTVFSIEATVLSPAFFVPYKLPQIHLRAIAR